jgi:hypothetical protein
LWCLGKNGRKIDVFMGKWDENRSFHIKMVQKMVQKWRLGGENGGLGVKMCKKKSMFLWENGRKMVYFR